VHRHELAVAAQDGCLLFVFRHEVLPEEGRIGQDGVNVVPAEADGAGDFAAISYMGSRLFETAQYRSSTTSGQSAMW
jgi:hypothetical protein